VVERCGGTRSAERQITLDGKEAETTDYSSRERGSTLIDGEPGSLVGLREVSQTVVVTATAVMTVEGPRMCAAVNPVNTTPSPDAPVITASGLVKSFGTGLAVDGLDLSVAEGEVHGFLGPNGAGKSTTIRMLLGLIQPSAGTARVFGIDPWAQPISAHRDVAYVPGDISLWPNLSGGESIDILTGLRGGADQRLLTSLIADFDFNPRKKARTYSKGNRQKVALIAAFARPARLYILDEPTSGLDPVMDTVFRHQIECVRADGATVLLSSHILGEVDQLCDRVTIIRAGQVVESGSLTELRHLSRTHFRVTGLADATVLQAHASVHDVRMSGIAVEFDVDADGLAGVLALLAHTGVTGLSVTPVSLETLFLRHFAVDLSQEAR
jgi:ABC-2 type transport system ATP-binding protein